MNEFKTYHPLVNLVYFIFTIGLSCFFMHPVCLGISLVCACTYSAIQKGGASFKKSLAYMIPAVCVMAIVNPAFNHRGATIIAYLPGGNPLTVESMVYGLAAAVMIVSVIEWFSCFNAVMTSDKIVCLFGRFIPSLSLIFSMTLRFVPRFSAQLRLAADSQRCIGRSSPGMSVAKRAKSALSLLSAMTTWALENSIDTADSMRSRGYGLSGRTSFTIFKFDRRDRRALFLIVILGVYTIAGAVKGAMHFSYFPLLSGGEVGLYGLSVFGAYFALCIYPVILELWEVRRWKNTELMV